MKVEIPVTPAIQVNTRFEDVSDCFIEYHNGLQDEDQMNKMTGPMEQLNTQEHLEEGERER